MGRDKKLRFEPGCRRRGWGWASKLGGLSCSHRPAGLHWEGTCNWRRRILLLRADEAKMLLRSLGFASGKKRKTRPKWDLLLRNTVGLDRGRVAVAGSGSESFWSALPSRRGRNARRTKRRENKAAKGNQANQVNAENRYALIYSRCSQNAFTDPNNARRFSRRG